MAIAFDGSTNGRIEYGPTAAIDNLSVLTCMFWTFIRANTNNANLLNKHVGLYLKCWGSGGNAGNMQFIRGRATTNTSYITNSKPFTTVDKTYFIAATFDTGATPEVAIYVGDLDTVPVEAAYGTSIDGAGALTSDSSGVMRLGNRNPAFKNWEGDISEYHLVSSALTLQQVIVQWGHMHVRTDTLIRSSIGRTGLTTQSDWSTNQIHGTMNGTLSIAAHDPIAPYVLGEMGSGFKVSGAAPVGHAGQLVNATRLHTKVGGVLV